MDAERIRLITRIFRNLGFGTAEASIRGRITYYHQVGYYALAVRESRRTRTRLHDCFQCARSSWQDRGILDDSTVFPLAGSVASVRADHLGRY